MSDRLQEIKDREAKATAGEWKAKSWEWRGYHGFVITVDDAEGTLIAEHSSATDSEEWAQSLTEKVRNDLSFAAGARQDVPYLIAEVERLRSVIESFGKNPAGFDWGVLERLDELEQENERLTAENAGLQARIDAAVKLTEPDRG